MKKIFSLATLICCLPGVTQWANALTYTVTVPAGTEVCYLTGAINNWSSTAAHKMEKVAGETNKFTITIAGATEEQEYKYLCGPDWAYEEAKNAEGDPLDANRTYNDSNGNDVVAFWKQLFVADTRTVTIEVWVPDSVHVLYITGSFNGWPNIFTDDYKMTYVGVEDNGKVFKFSITYDDPKNMEFKFVAGPDWAFEQREGNFRYGNFEESAPNTISLAVFEFKAIFDPNKVGDIHIKATVPLGTSRVWIQGSFLGWSWDDPQEMTKNDDGTFSYTIPFVQQTEYRLYNGPDWGYPEAAEGDLATERPNRAASFDPDDPDKINEITVWGWKTEVNSIPFVNSKSFKIHSENGQIMLTGATQVQIVDILGKRIQSEKVFGAFTSKTLHPGIYVVKADGVSQKVIVK